ncbi:hypothetical protein Ancab_018074 [Ancistrocladus abbreviatus]
MEKETDTMKIFDMDDLEMNLPRKRGLSRYYSGKARSFTCLLDVQTVEDLKKPKPKPNDQKKRQKHSENPAIQMPQGACRPISGGNPQHMPPCVGV